MNSVKYLQRLPKVISANHSLLKKQQNADNILLTRKWSLAKGNVIVGENLVAARKLHWRLYASNSNFVNLPRNAPNLSRDFLVQLWIADADGKTKRIREKRKQNYVEDVFGTKGLLASGSSVTEDSKQFVAEPASQEVASIAPLLSRSNLLITRDIEWANLTLGFEQENRYAIVDVSNPQVPAGFIREESNVIVRQLLRTRRPFVATITDGYGNELFRVRRPFWWITSSIYAEVNGKEIGVVHRRWHLWKRVYDLYLGDEQFAVVENPGFWYWTFTLKGRNGEVLAEIDRDWRGFGFEVFTDAGQYVIRFGSAVDDPVSHLSEKIQEFEVARPLTLLERAVTVALAVSLDNDYFSRHGGWGLPFIAVTE